MQKKLARINCIHGNRSEQRMRWDVVTYVIFINFLLNFCIRKTYIIYTKISLLSNLISGEFLQMYFKSICKRSSIAAAALLYNHLYLSILYYNTALIIL